MTEARLEEKEPTSLDRKPEAAEHQEVLEEDAVVKPVKGQKNWHRGEKQAAGRRGEPKELTQRDCESQRTILNKKSGNDEQRKIDDGKAWNAKRE
jgi:hypothetical protein